MKRLYDIIWKALYAITDYCNAKANEYYNKSEAITEAEYDQLIEDFYENGIGYYGKR